MKSRRRSPPRGSRSASNSRRKSPRASPANWRDRRTTILRRRGSTARGAVDAGPDIEVDGQDGADDDSAFDETHTAFADDPSAWRSSVVASINDTRDELKSAHQSVARLRRQLTEVDSRRRRRREQIDASLGRAETLLTEIRNAWR